MKLQILEALYGGELRLGEQNIPDKEEYWMAIDLLDSERKKFPEAEQKCLDKILEYHTAVLSYEVEEAFFRGFAIGVKLMNEVDLIDLKIGDMSCYDRI